MQKKSWLTNFNCGDDELYYKMAIYEYEKSGLPGKYWIEKEAFIPSNGIRLPNHKSLHATEKDCSAFWRIFDVIESDNPSYFLQWLGSII